MAILSSVPVWAAVLDALQFFVRPVIDDGEPGEEADAQDFAKQLLAGQERVLQSFVNWEESKANKVQTCGIEDNGF